MATQRTQGHDADTRQAALAGLRVVDLSNEWSILTGNILADLGADVVHVEPPGGSSARSLGPFNGDTGRREDSLFWAAYARNQRGVSLDIARPDGASLLLSLVDRADILIESFPPGHLAALGLGYDVLAQRNPRLIVAAVTPFGQDGPKARWPATDLTVMAASNFMLANGDDDRPPLGIPFPQSFLHAGAEAAVACLIALQERRASGLGQQIDVSGQEALTNCTQSFILSAAWNDKSFFRMPAGERRRKTGLSGVYRAVDGFVVIGFFFGSALGPLAQRFIDWIFEEGMCDERIRQKNWPNYMALLESGEETVEDLEEVHGVIERFTQTKTKQQLLDGALERGILMAPASTVEDVLESPQLEARKFWASSGSPEDEWRYPGGFARFSESPIKFTRRAPRIGEHNVEVFVDELCIPRGHLQRLAENGVV